MAASFSTDVLSRLAHDLKSPLTAVRVLADMIREDADPRTRADLTQLLVAVDQAVVQAEGVSFYARCLAKKPESGRLGDLQKLARKLASREAFLDVKVRGQTSLHVQEGATHRVLMSVLQNAVQMSRKQIWLELDEEGVRIIHEGLLLTEEQRAALFESASSEPNRRVRSAALGLWAAAEVMVGMGGELRAMEALEGFTVELRFPQAP